MACALELRELPAHQKRSILMLLLIIAFKPVESWKKGTELHDLEQHEPSEFEKPRNISLVETRTNRYFWPPSQQKHSLKGYFIHTLGAEAPCHKPSSVLLRSYQFKVLLKDSVV